LRVRTQESSGRWPHVHAAGATLQAIEWTRRHASAESSSTASRLLPRRGLRETRPARLNVSGPRSRSARAPRIGAAQALRRLDPRRALHPRPTARTAPAAPVLGGSAMRATQARARASFNDQIEESQECCRAFRSWRDAPEFGLPPSRLVIVFVRSSVRPSALQICPATSLCFC